MRPKTKGSLGNILVVEITRKYRLIDNINKNLRASLLTSNVSSLMLIKSHDPPIEVFKLEMYVRSWLEEHHSDNDNQSTIKNLFKI